VHLTGRLFLLPIHPQRAAAASSAPPPRPSSLLAPPPQLVSPATDFLPPLAAPQPGDKAALDREPPGVQRHRDQLRRGVRPLQPGVSATGTQLQRVSWTEEDISKA
ncbi:NAD-dependent protein deacetylase SRT1, partial [Zea mays]